MKCQYCGRDKQTQHHKTCDGCGATKPKIYCKFMGRDITDLDEYCGLVEKYKHVFGYSVLKQPNMVIN